jgi:hypothetical protein
VPGYPYPPGLPDLQPEPPAAAPRQAPAAEATAPPAGQSGGISIQNSDVKVRGDMVAGSKTVKRGRR